LRARAAAEADTAVVVVAMPRAAVASMAAAADIGAAADVGVADTVDTGADTVGTGITVAATTVAGTGITAGTGGEVAGAAADSGLAGTSPYCRLGMQRTIGAAFRTITPTITTTRGMALPGSTRRLSLLMG